MDTYFIDDECMAAIPGLPVYSFRVNGSERFTNCKNCAEMFDDSARANQPVEHSYASCDY